MAGTFFRRQTCGADQDGQLTCIYMGVAEGLRYIAPFVETALLPSASLADPETVPEADLAKGWHDVRADLAILVADETTVERLRSPGDLHAVARIHQVVPTGDSWNAVEARMSRREVKRGRQARQDGFSYDVSRQDEDFYFFYRSMHQPTMARRYGALARSVTEEQAFTELFRQGVLFRVFWHGTWVAGSVSQIDRARRRLNARLIGVRDGDEASRLREAQNFVYHSILDWATGHPSIREVDLQGCEPFLSKGTFQYKKRFGTTAVLPDNLFGSLRMLIRADLGRSSVRSFLVANPFLTHCNGTGLWAVYCFDSVRPPRLELPHASPGIAGHLLLDLDTLVGSRPCLPQASRRG